MQQRFAIAPPHPKSELLAAAPRYRTPPHLKKRIACSSASLSHPHIPKSEAIALFIISGFNLPVIKLRSPNFTVFLDKSQPGSKWNHSYGVAIDIASSEIVYWAEKW
ncbi:MAG: hypothetical protein ACK46N_18975 [Dolichospermum sp.]